MKILGTKFFGQEASVYYIDTSTKKIFAINSDRISRIKKDNISIKPILNNYLKREFMDFDILAYPFNNFDGNDALLETKGTSYYWLNLQDEIRKITKPKFRKDLYRKKTFYEKILLIIWSIFNLKISYYFLVRKYYWNKYKKNLLGKQFHKSLVSKYIKEVMLSYGKRPDITYVDHHVSHAFSSYYHSPFAYVKDAIVFTLDEHGDECHSKVFLFYKNNDFIELGKSKSIKFEKDGIFYVTSIAGMYSNFTEAMDLVRSSDEGKVEAIAAYGVPDKNILNDLKTMTKINDFSFELDLKLFKQYSDKLFLKKLRETVGDENFCATIQNWLEYVATNLLNNVYSKHPVDCLCLAGGAAANVIMNFKIWEKTPFKELYIVPPMGDEGAGAGAAIKTAIDKGIDISWIKQKEMPYYGPEFSRKDVLKAIKKFNTVTYEDLNENWYLEAAKSISENKVIGLFQGKMEFGPRALGNRSILANAADPKARDKINSTIKKRPAYQPFCPTVLEEERERLFENTFKHKHMATAFMIKSKFRKDLYSGTHIDGTARPQFIEYEDNRFYYKLIQEVKKKTGYGMVINTSFNLHGRTIVNTPKDAITDFLDCNMDELYIEGFKIKRI